MNATTYKVTGGGYAGHAYAMYENGFLRMLMAEFSAPETFEEPVDFPLREVDLVNSIVYKGEQLKAKSAGDKIALFVLKYKQHKDIAYRATKQERANITHVTVTEQLLNTYFTTTQYPLAGTKSITDYIKHYNEVRDLAQNGTPAKSAFPDVYDREYEKHIGDDTSKLQRYWEHLRSKGWKRQDGVWIKA